MKEILVMKILIVDDEPLVQIGIKTMLTHIPSVELCGTASDGVEALELIEQLTPDLVITDIKMPRMDGLSLVKTCRETYGNLPEFIILTSYEDFTMAKAALSHHVLDYIIKLELNETILRDVIKQAEQRINEYSHHSTDSSSEPVEMLLYKERFFIRLLNNLFENETQFLLQKQDLNLDFPEGTDYCVIYLELTGGQLQTLSQAQLMTLYGSTKQMLETMLSKFLTFHCISLDLRHVALVTMSESLPASSEDFLAQFNNCLTMIQNYYNVSIVGVIGPNESSPLRISHSYQVARNALVQVTTSPSIQYAKDDGYHRGLKNTFNISLFKNELVQAYEEYDATKLCSVFDTITELFQSHPNHYLQAMDVVSNILYLSLSLLADGETYVSQIFEVYPDNYHSLYRLTTIGQLIDWLQHLVLGLSSVFEEKKKDYSNMIIHNAKRYIAEHIHEKLSQNEVAAVFGISPQYLSALFKKHAHINFTEYVTSVKMEKAKHLLSSGDYKIYEVADLLGYENAFYFSTVFKKSIGLSPRDYITKKGIVEQC